LNKNNKDAVSLVIRKPAVTLMLAVAAVVTGIALAFLAAMQVTEADAQSTSFNPTTANLVNNGDTAVITVQTQGVDANVDRVQLGILHPTEFSISSPQCAGIFLGATLDPGSPIPGANQGDPSQGTVIGCALQGPASGTTGDVMTFVLTRLGDGNPTIAFGAVPQGFETQFSAGGTPVGPGTLNTLQVTGGQEPQPSPSPSPSPGPSPTPQPGLDFGDAPDPSHPSKQASDGARHLDFGSAGDDSGNDPGLMAAGFNQGGPLFIGFGRSERSGSDGTSRGLLPGFWHIGVGFSPNGARCSGLVPRTGISRPNAFGDYWTSFPVPGTVPDLQSGARRFL